MPLLWVACVAWLLVDLKPFASSWASGLRQMRSLRTIGSSFGSPAPRLCSQLGTWFRIMHYYGLQYLAPQEELPFFKWWLPTRKQIHKLRRKGFDSLALLVVLSLWKERNRHVHDRAALQPVALAPLILEEARRWARVRFAGIASLDRLRLRL
jgi:hypothetical protein